MKLTPFKYEKRFILILPVIINILCHKKQNKTKHNLHIHAKNYRQQIKNLINLFSFLFFEKQSNKMKGKLQEKMVIINLYSIKLYA